MTAVCTLLSSTFAFQSLNASDVADGFELGRNNNKRVATRPTIHTVCVHRGAGFFAVDGRGGSVGGPDFAGLE